MKYIFILVLVLFCFSACQESLEKRAARELKEYTLKKCPTPIINDVQTDSANYEPETKTIHYYQKLCNRADNAEAINQHKSEIVSSMKDNLKANTANKTYKDNGFNFRYTYRSQKEPNKIILDVTFTPKDYK